MDSDAEMDSMEANLLNKFRSMGTTDKEVLISQFQDLLGFQLNPAGCAFFLDMTGWNLQSAIGAYYDFEGGHEYRLPSMSFVSHINVSENDCIPPNTPFLKTWRVRNSGKDQWPGGCFLRFVNGDRMGGEISVSMPSLPAGEMTDISINLVSPTTPGIYQGQWRSYTNTDTPFGDSIFVTITVQCEDTLQLDRMHFTVANESGDSTSISDSRNMLCNQPSLPQNDEEMRLEDSDSTLSNTSHLHSKGFNL